jgi:hypothetical protein
VSRHERCNAREQAHTMSVACCTFLRCVTESRRKSADDSVFVAREKTSHQFDGLTLLLSETETLTVLGLCGIGVRAASTRYAGPGRAVRLKFDLTPAIQWLKRACCLEFVARYLRSAFSIQNQNDSVQIRFRPVLHLYGRQMISKYVCSKLQFPRSEQGNS